MLDERLSAAAALALPGELAADVGTDHGLLPCALLEAGVYQRMILTDISEKALSHARAEVSGRGLGDRVTFCCGDGLKPLAGAA